jgi:hypothetical protein
MNAMPASYTSDAHRREPKTDAERALLKSLQIMFVVYDFTRLDRVSLSRDIIAALEAAEKINAE